MRHAGIAQFCPEVKVQGYEHYAPPKNGKAEHYDILNAMVEAIATSIEDDILLSLKSRASDGVFGVLVDETLNKGLKESCLIYVTYFDCVDLEFRCEMLCNEEIKGGTGAELANALVTVLQDRGLCSDKYLLAFCSADGAGESYSRCVRLTESENLSCCRCHSGRTKGYAKAPAGSLPSATLILVNGSFVWRVKLLTLRHSPGVFAIVSHWHSRMLRKMLATSSSSSSKPWMRCSSCTTTRARRQRLCTRPRKRRGSGLSVSWVASPPGGLPEVTRVVPSTNFPTPHIQ